MRRFPSDVAYKASISRPGTHVRLPDLPPGRFAWSQRRRGPLAWRGAYAVVFKYQASTCGRAWAVRCPTAPLACVESHQRLLARYIERHPAPYLLSSKWVERAVLVDGSWWPALVSEWTGDEDLKRYVGAHRYAGLGGLVRAWQSLSDDMRSRGIAHGDLHHENIRVSGPPAEPRLVLIDYDSFVVPENVGAPEILCGTADYQHPSRSSVTSKDPRVDYFASLVIELGLTFIDADPDAWTRHGLESTDGMLLTERDFRDPSASTLIAEARNHARTRSLALEVEESLRSGQPFGVPRAEPLSETRRGLRRTALATTTESVAVAAPSASSDALATPSGRGTDTGTADTTTARDSESLGVAERSAARRQTLEKREIAARTAQFQLLPRPRKHASVLPGVAVAIAVVAALSYVAC